MGTYSSKDVVGGADGSLEAGMGAAGGGIPTRQHSAQQQQYYGGRQGGGSSAMAIAGGSTPRGGGGVPIGASAGLGASPFEPSPLTTGGAAPTVVVPAGTSVGSKPMRIGGEGTPTSTASISLGADSSSVAALQAVGDETNDTVPTVFRWEHGGRNVYVTGTFNNWEKQIPMHRSGNDFTYIHNLKKGKHAFKFVVDDEWRFAPDQPTISDVEGRINNYIDVTGFVPYTGDLEFFLRSREQKLNDSEFGTNIPDLDEYTKEPPLLPPHLRQIILNKPAPSADPLALPSPNSVTLHHLYCTAIRDGIMVLGTSNRYRNKYITLVFYSSMPTTSNIPIAAGGVPQS